jgi:hypothetical protein
MHTRGESDGRTFHRRSEWEGVSLEEEAEEVGTYVDKDTLDCLLGEEELERLLDSLSGSSYTPTTSVSIRH